MSFINLICILGVGYLIVLHIYLFSQGLTTYEYVKKGQEEIAAQQKKVAAEDSQESSDNKTVKNKMGHYDISLVARRGGVKRKNQNDSLVKLQTPSKINEYSNYEEEKNPSTITKYSPHRLNNHTTSQHLHTSLAKEDLLMQLEEETNSFKKFQLLGSPPKIQNKQRKVQNNPKSKFNKQKNNESIQDLHVNHLNNTNNNTATQFN